MRIGDIGDDLYAIFINDMSEQRRFEAVRRDFVTNVSHELKTPAGAIALLAETVTDAADDPDAVRYFSGRISKESARLTELCLLYTSLECASVEARPFVHEVLEVHISLVRFEHPIVVHDWYAQMNPVSYTHLRKEKVTPKGSPALVKPINSGIEEQEQNGVTVPSRAAMIFAQIP